MVRLGLALISLCLVSVQAGIMDTLKGALGFPSVSSSTNSDIKNAAPGRNDLPNYFRIEAEITRLENDRGLKSNGGSCDTMGQCDPMVFAYVDVLKATSPFPGAQSVESFPKIFEVDNVNSPKINKVITADVCNKELSKATLRVHVEDKNTVFSHSVINDFDCYIGGNVGRTMRDAKWSNPGYCVGKFQDDKIKLVFRNRIYRIDPSQCTDSSLTPTTTPKSGFFG